MSWYYVQYKSLYLPSSIFDSASIQFLLLLKFLTIIVSDTMNYCKYNVQADKYVYASSVPLSELRF
jgi:hypothetical protein